MGIIYQTDKRVGITYAYENESYWDKEKKQPRSRRKLIGRVDAETGEIVPTDGRGRRRRPKDADAQDTDYRKLYERLLKKCARLEALVAALQKELADRTRA